MIKLNKVQKDTLAQIAADKYPTCSAPTLVLLLHAGLIGYESSNYSLTAEGKAIAEAWEAECKVTRLARNRAARLRTGAMRSVGMTRTRNGSWE